MFTRRDICGVRQTLTSCLSFARLFAFLDGIESLTEDQYLTSTRITFNEADYCESNACLDRV